MKQSSKEDRKRQIAEAAYCLLETKGFGGTSMLAIAKAAKASNETLYRWYGDKTGLFAALVAANADEVRAQLEAELDAQENPVQILSKISPVLLSVLVGDRAIALNRAAAADSSGTLGEAITAAGRQSIAPLIATTLVRARDTGAISFEDPQDAVALFLDLLVGDLQIRRAIGQIPCLSDDAIRDRAAQAVERLQILLSGPPETC
jgi:AcrR family transcriptional regulator